MGCGEKAGGRLEENVGGMGDGGIEGKGEWFGMGGIGGEFDGEKGEIRGRGGMGNVVWV